MKLKLVVSLVLLVSSAPTTAQSVDAFNALRSTLVPMLRCERGFDVQRRKQADEWRILDRMPYDTTDDRDNWQKQWNDLNAKKQQFLQVRADTCKAGFHLDRLKLQLARLRPDLPANKVQIFASGFSNEIRKLDEAAADFRDKYYADQYTPPSPPPPRK